VQNYFAPVSLEPAPRSARNRNAAVWPRLLHAMVGTGRFPPQDKDLTMGTRELPTLADRTRRLPLSPQT